MTLVYGSLFTGVGGFDLGFEAAGWHCAWMVEIDPVCQAVLRRHWPDVPAFGDVRDCGATNLAPVDAIVFGSPCQDLSVAGKRAGFEGERSGLFHEAIRIIRELRPTWAVWENVVGSLSSVRGRDFGTALDALADSGALDICWRVLDAQFWGVAQRRRRVFVVADFRSERAAEVLFESAGVRRDSAAGGTSREAVAGTLGGGAGSRGWAPDTDRMTFVAFDRYNQTIGLQAGTLQAEARSNSQPAVLSGAVSSKRAKGTGGPAGDECYNLIAQSVALRGRDGGAAAELGGTVAGALRGSQGGGDKAYALTASNGHHGHSSPRADGSDNQVVAAEAVARTVTANYGKQPDSSDTSKGPPNLITAPYTVRRLTPRECERLQGWPDDWTRWRDDGTEIADGPRYRMIGNGVVANLAAWLAERLAAAQKEGYPPERSVTTPNVPPPRPAERSPGSQPSMQTTPNAAAPDHPNRSGQDLDGALTDRPAQTLRRRAQMAEKPPRRPDRSSASPLAIAPSDLALSASDERNADG